MDKSKLCYVEQGIIEGHQELSYFTRIAVDEADKDYSGWHFYSDSENNHQMVISTLAAIVEKHPIITVHLNSPVGSQFKMSEQGRVSDITTKNLKTIDSKTFASHQGNTKVDRWRWTKICLSFVWDDNKIFLRPLIACMITFLLSCIFLSWFWLVITLILGAIAIYHYKTWVEYWAWLEERFQYGDANPAIIVSIEPYIMLAISTDLKKGIGKYPIIKLSGQNNLHKARLAKNIFVGARLATVALYQRTPPEVPYWGDFYPLPIDYVTTDQKLLSTFFEKEWIALEGAIKTLPQPYVQGLYRINVQESSWLEHTLEEVKKWCEEMIQ